MPNESAATVDVRILPDACLPDDIATTFERSTDIYVSRRVYRMIASHDANVRRLGLELVKKLLTLPERPSPLLPWKPLAGSDIPPTPRFDYVGLAIPKWSAHAITLAPVPVGSRRRGKIRALLSRLGRALAPWGRRKPGD